MGCCLGVYMVSGLHVGWGGWGVHGVLVGGLRHVVWVVVGYMLSGVVV